MPLPKIHVRGFILGRYPIRGFLAWLDGDDAAVFVDPGGWDEAVLDVVRDYELSVRAILLTHGHWDHVEGLSDAIAALEAPVYAHAADTSMFAEIPEHILDGDARITCGALTWRALHVPGHSPGSMAYTAGDVLFSGDTLFAGAIGGTATPEHYEQERHMIATKLLPLGDDVRVYPAHGPATVIGVERRANPFLRSY